MGPILNDPPSNLDKVLGALGRASTPDVAQSNFGITLGQLLGIEFTHRDSEVIVVGSELLLTTLGAVARCMRGIPGLLPEQVSLPHVYALVIDWDAFDHGPWLGANTHTTKSLSDELFEAGRLLRARGKMVLGIPRRACKGTADAYLLSTCTVDLTNVPDVDLEEGARNSSLWDTALAYTQSTRNIVDRRP